MEAGEFIIQMNSGDLSFLGQRLYDARPDLFKAEQGVPGMQGPMGMKGKDAEDPFRIDFNEPVVEFTYQGVSFIIPFNPDDYPAIDSADLDKETVAFINAIYPELFAKMALFWYREYKYQRAQDAFLAGGEDGEFRGVR